MKMLFLDVDGVLNDHRRWANGYSPILIESVRPLNIILAEEPELKLVLSSAWRYPFTMIPAIETLLCVFGVNAFGRVDGLTCTDEEIHEGSMPPKTDVREWKRLGLIWRAEQIKLYARAAEVERFVVLDDLPLDVPNLVQTNPSVGLTESDVPRVLSILRGTA